MPKTLWVLMMKIIKIMPMPPHLIVNEAAGNVSFFSLSGYMKRKGTLGLPIESILHININNLLILF